MPGIPPPLAIDIIILRASKKRSTSWLTSETWRPEPLAIRARREPSIILGLARSAGVIDWMTAWIRSISRSSKFSSCSRNCPIPGSIPMIFDIEPSLRTCCICSRKSSRVNSPPWPVSFAAALAACSWSNVFSACSIRVITSPMSRIRDAIRSGWNRSKSVSFSPAEANMTGLPVTERDRQRGTTAGVAVELGEDDAVVPDAVEERLGGRDGVLADHRVDDEEHLVGVRRRRGCPRPAASSRRRRRAGRRCRR